MKAILTLIVVILIGAIALAQNTDSHENKTEYSEVGLLLDHCAVRSLTCEEHSQIGDIARLYKRSNTRVNRALNFSTKYTKAKLA